MSAKATATRLLPWGALLGGLALRLSQVPNARFTGDEGTFYEVAQRIVRDHFWPVLGPAVSGTEAKHPGATFYYLMALPNLFGASPLLSGFFIATLSVASLVLLVRMVRATRGDGAALAVAWLAATSPWTILYADRIWNSNVAPWIGLLALYAVWRIREKERSWWAATAIVALGVLPQFHLSSPILWAVVLVQLALWRPRLRWAAVGVGVAVTLLLYAPYIVHEVKTGWSNVHAILADAGGKEVGLGQAARGAWYVLLFGTGDASYHFHTGYWKPYDPLWQSTSRAGLSDALTLYGPVLFGFVALSFAFVAAGYAAGLSLLVRGKDTFLRFVRDPFWTALLVGSVAAFGLLAMSHKPAYPHYANLLLPIGVVPLADGVMLLVSRRNPWLRRTGIALTVALGLAFAAIAVRYYDKVDSKVSVATSLSMVELIHEQQGSQPFRLQFGYFHNGWAMSKLARWTLDVPWHVNAKAKTTWFIREAGDDPDRAARGKARLWEVGPMWLVRR